MDIGGHWQIHRAEASFEGHKFAREIGVPGGARTMVDALFQPQLR